jgi:hypothetical protein
MTYKGEVSPVLEGFDPIPLDDAAALLESESGLASAELTEIAAMLDAEPPVLRWAAGLAKTTGWGPLRTRILQWSSLGRASWHEDVAKVVAALSTEDAALLTILSACDAPFAWDVLEAVVPDVAIDGLGRLEEARVLRRKMRAGVVTFIVPYAVRAYQRATHQELRPAAWLAAWVARANQLRASSYGPNAAATLTELGAAVPLAARALFDATTEKDALALWTAASDAMFFGDAIAFDAPAFARAIIVADSIGTTEERARSRLVAARAVLERGDPAAARALADDALKLDVFRADALRGKGWRRSR